MFLSILLSLARWYLNVLYDITPIDPVIKYIGLVILGGLLNSQYVFIVPIDNNKWQPQHNILSFHCLPLYFLFNTVYIVLQFMLNSIKIIKYYN